MMSLLDNGVSRCNGGFGPSSTPRDISDMPCKTGELQWTPASNTATGVVNELDLMLTGGTMSEWQKGIAVKAYSEAADKGESGLKAAQQVTLMTPEFHTDGKQEDLGEQEPKPEVQETDYNNDYK